MDAWSVQAPAPHPWTRVEDACKHDSPRGLMHHCAIRLLHSSPFSSPNCGFLACLLHSALLSKGPFKEYGSRPLYISASTEDCSGFTLVGKTFLNAQAVQSGLLPTTLCVSSLENYIVYKVQMLHIRGCQANTGWIFEVSANCLSWWKVGGGGCDTDCLLRTRLSVEASWIPHVAHGIFLLGQNIVDHLTGNLSVVKSLWAHQHCSSDIVLSSSLVSYFFFCWSPHISLEECIAVHM